jgi:hypothetical protein
MIITTLYHIEYFFEVGVQPYFAVLQHLKLIIALSLLCSACTNPMRLW